MALATITFILSLLIVLTLIKRFTNKNKIPKGLKPLPGPKGLSYSLVTQKKKKKKYLTYAMMLT
jgi:hypothetical protein